MPTPFEFADRRQMILFWFMILSAAVLLIATHIRLPNPVFDDAYITYRYAANFAQGDGLVYNSGERVLGTTTPGYALLLGGLGTIFGVEQIPVLSRAVNLSALLIAASAALLIVKRLGESTWIGGVIFVLLLLTPNTWSASISGMESPVFVALMTLGILWYVQERWLPAMLAFGLLPLIRPEAIFVLVLVVMAIGLRLIRRQATVRDTLRLLLVLGLPGLLWVVIATLYYDSPIPQPIIAKRAGLYLLDAKITTFHVMRDMLRSLTLFDATVDASRADVPGYLFREFVFLLVIGGGSIFILAVGGLAIIRRHRPLMIVPVFAFVMLIFYATSATLIFPHYYALFEGLLHVLWWGGLARLLHDLSPNLLRRGVGKRSYQLMMTVVTGLVLLPLLILYPWQSVWHGEIRDGFMPKNPILRLQQYEALIERFGDAIPSGTRIMMPEIGVLGFMLDHVTVLDAGGLVSPEATAYHPVPPAQRPGGDIGVIPPHYVRDAQPDMVITLEIFGRHGVFDDDWFAENYIEVSSQDGDWLPWGSGPLTVHRRHDFAFEQPVSAS